jgi:hypothetical protein
MLLKANKYIILHAISQFFKKSDLSIEFYSVSSDEFLNEIKTILRNASFINS